jgi:stearoyl-CoA desaturase (delta-9 desaturase)
MMAARPVSPPPHRAEWRLLPWSLSSQHRSSDRPPCEWVRTPDGGTKSRFRRPTLSTTQPAAQIHVPVMLFLLLTPVVGIAGTAVYTYLYGFELWMLLLAVGMYAAVGLSITAGYHRCLSHRSYEASKPVQYFFAIFGAMAAQNSALWWSAGHRVHHQYVDRDWDPYNINRGFWWAHILWVFHKHEPADVNANTPDLLQNPVVMWQHRWYKLILIVGGFGLPALIGWMCGDAIAGLLWGGFLRLVVIHHTTFFVNSLAHSMGKPAYNAEVSARDNWLVALLTLGEGYHSFHHRFPSDFRNGIRWYHWDPAKWFIATLHRLGLAKQLRATPPPQVELARMTSEVKEVESRLESARGEVADAVRHLLADARAHLELARVAWRERVDHAHDRGSVALREMHRNARRHIREARRRWKEACRIAATGALQID